jgi:hypothetical protein
MAADQLFYRGGELRSALELSLIAQDLLAWTQTLSLDAELADSDPKRLRYRNADLAVMPTLI